jgi:hypothetical protein
MFLLGFANCRGGDELFLKSRSDLEESRLCDRLSDELLILIESKVGADFQFKDLTRRGKTETMPAANLQ